MIYLKNADPERLRRWAARAREWAVEAEALPGFSKNVRLVRMAAAKRRAADGWDAEAKAIEERGR